MPYNELTSKHLNNLKSKLQETISSKGMGNTGGAYDSLEVKGNQLLGNDYIYYLDQGRRPGKFPPVKNMQEWVSQKLGLQGNEMKRAAYAIGLSMKENGTKIYQDKSKGIQLENLVNEMLEDLYKELPNEVAVEALRWL